MRHNHRIHPRLIPGSKQLLAKTILVTALILPTYAIADDYDYVCRKNGETRTIKVEYDHKGWDLPCSVRYEKNTEKTVGDSVTFPWRAEATPGYCEGRTQFLADKLSGLGWQCEAAMVTEQNP